MLSWSIIRARAWHSSMCKCCLRRCSCVCEAGRKSWRARLSFRWRCTTQTRKGATVQEAALTTVCPIRVSHPSISTACTATHRWDPRGWSHRNGYFGRSKQRCCLPEWWDQAELISLDVSISFLKNSLNWIFRHVWMQAKFYLVFIHFSHDGTAMLIKRREKEGSAACRKCTSFQISAEQRASRGFFRGAQP